MNLYKFNCTVWVRGNTAEQAHQELHDEVLYHYLQDNYLFALDSDQGVLVEGDEQ